MGNQSSLLRPRRIRAGSGGAAQQQQQQQQQSQAAALLSKYSAKAVAAPLAPFKPNAATAGLLLGVSAGQRLRYSSLAALLKATPATALLTAQRQHLVTVKTSDKSLRAAFEKLIGANVLSAPVWSDAQGRWVGFLDVRDLADLILLRYLWRRDAQAATAKPAAAATADGKKLSSHATHSSKPGDAKQNESGAAAGGAAAGAVSPAAGITAGDFIDDALAVAAKSGPDVSAAAPVSITIESLAERYPWRPLPSTASLFDVARELLNDVRRVPIIDVTTEQLVGVVTQSAIIAFLASRMSEVSARGHAIKAPLLFNATANAVATADAGAAKPAAAATPAAGDNKQPTLAPPTSSPGAIAAATSEVAKAAAATGEAAAAASAARALNGLELAETGHSEWQVPMHELSLPGASATGEGPAPSLALGSCPVWTLAADTPLVEALWAMSEAATSSAAIRGADGGLQATLSTADLKLYLRNATAGGGAHKFSDALLELDALDFVAHVRRAEASAAVDAAVRAKTPAEREAAFGAEKSHVQVLSVGTNASLAQVVHRLAVSRAHKIYVVGASAPFVPLRVITLTDILRYVVAADEAEAAAAPAAAAPAAAAPATAAATVAAN